MNSKQLLAHFERISDAPEAVAHFRRFILKLGASGRLVRQDSADEPISTLLKRIAPLPKPPRYSRRSRELVLGDCALSIGDPGTPVPPGWARVPLVEIARIESGHTPSRNRKDWWGGDIRWMGLVDARIHDGGVICETIQKTNEQGIANSAARVLPAGTVCFSRTASVGYVVILGRAIATSQDFVNWVPSEVVTSRWLQLVLTAEKSAMSRFSKGAVHQTVYYPAWLSMHICLPPLAEQHRIIAKVDELMALCDSLEAAQAERENHRDQLVTASLARLSQPADDQIRFSDHARFHLDHVPRLTTRVEHVHQLRKTIVDLAVRGRLVEPERGDDPTYLLLERIRAERARLLGKGELRRREEMAPITEDEVPFALPPHWALVRLGDALDLTNGRAFKPSEWVKSGVPIIRIQNLNNTDAPFNYYDGPIAEKHRVRSGDFLISWSGTPGTSFGAHTWHRGEGVLNQHIFRARQIGAVFVSDFLKLAINSRLLELIGKAQGGVGLQHITKPKLEQLPLTLPPLAEQHRIVAKVDHLMAVCDQLEAQLKAGETESRRLLEAVLHDALAPAA